MRFGKGFEKHVAAPKDWRRTPNMSGDYDFDASIAHCTNSDVPAKLQLYLRGQRNNYGPITAYSGYSNYDGDS